MTCIPHAYIARIYSSYVLGQALLVDKSSFELIITLRPLQKHRHSHRIYAKYHFFSPCKTLQLLANCYCLLSQNTLKVSICYSKFDAFIESPGCNGFFVLGIAHLHLNKTGYSSSTEPSLEIGQVCSSIFKLDILRNSMFIVNVLHIIWVI